MKVGMGEGNYWVTSISRRPCSACVQSFRRVLLGLHGG